MKEQNPELLRSMNLIRELGLEKGREIKHMKYEGVIKIPTVHNDYHSRATNQGYSRNSSGGIYPK